MHYLSLQPSAIWISRNEKDYRDCSGGTILIDTRMRGDPETIPAML